jgi:hypothetical protein
MNSGNHSGKRRPGRRRRKMPRGKDGLYRRENNIFAFRYKDMAGTWREKYTGTADRAEAKRMRQQFLDEVAADRLPADMADWRLNQAEQWWNEFRAPESQKARIARNPTS